MNWKDDPRPLAPTGNDCFFPSRCAHAMLPPWKEPCRSCLSNDTFVIEFNPQPKGPSPERLESDASKARSMNMWGS